MKLFLHESKTYVWLNPKYIVSIHPGGHESLTKIHMSTGHSYTVEKIFDQMIKEMKNGPL